MQKIMVLSVSLLVLPLSANEEIYYNSDLDQSTAGHHQWSRDPFTPSQLMYEQVGMQDNKANNILGFIPSSQTTKIPKMKLKGLINKDKEAFIALLEIQGVGTFMVREGDEFNIDPSQPKTAIRISQITRLSITVETGRLGSIRVLR
ncbi:MAG: hypothetical protein IBX55_20615 [Methyloprofundus sp.]|nr:hypothetical protein [Methyloprofundus sp.]